MPHQFLKPICSLETQSKTNSPRKNKFSHQKNKMEIGLRQKSRIMIELKFKSNQRRRLIKGMILMKELLRWFRFSKSQKPMI